VLFFTKTRLKQKSGNPQRGLPLLLLFDLAYLQNLFPAGKTSVII